MQIFKNATLFFSRDTPSLAQVIPAMDHIDMTLTNNSLDPDLHPAIRGACKLAKLTLNKYYSLTDAADSYRISICTLRRPVVL
jgi:hypothetical protein